MICERCGKDAVCYDILPTNDINVTANWCIDCIKKPGRVSEDRRDIEAEVARLKA